MSRVARISDVFSPGDSQSLPPTYPPLEGLASTTQALTLDVVDGGTLGVVIGLLAGFFCLCGLLLLLLLRFNRRPKEPAETTTAAKRSFEEEFFDVIIDRDDDVVVEVYDHRKPHFWL